MLGAFFALLSAATFGFNSASARRGMISGTVFQALSVTVPIGVPLFLIAALVFGQWDAIFGFSTLSYVYLCVAGMIHFTWGRYCNYRATKAMGANLTGPVQQFNLVVALAVAMIVLGEQLTAMRILGLVLVFIGPAIMIGGRRKGPTGGPTEKAKTETVSESGAGSVGAAAVRHPGQPTSSKPAPAKPAFEPKYVEGFVFALLSATGQGVSPTLVRLALAGQHDVSMAGGFISYVAATALFACFLVPKGRVQHIVLMDRRVLPWFLNSGFFAFVAQMFRYLALSIAPVSVVTPIQRLAMVFRTVFSTLLSREHEVLDARVVVGIVISLIGAVALAASTGSLAQYLPLPASFLEWRWP